MTMTLDHRAATTLAPAATRTARRRPPRPRPPEAPSWSCDNCTQVNAGRRRRCADCGTSCR